MKKKIILFQPVIGKWETNSIGLPLGLLSISRLLWEFYDIIIVDQRVDIHWKQTLYENITDETICFATTCFSGNSIKGAIEASKFVKQHFNLPVVWGGVHSSVLPSSTIKETFIDFIVVGDGEWTFKKLITALESINPDFSNIEGLVYKKKNKIYMNKRRSSFNFQGLPPINYNLVDLNKYDRINVEASRGCTNFCSYCYNQDRNMTVQSFLDFTNNIKELYFNFKVKEIDLVDDNAFYSKKRMLSFAKYLLDNQIKLTWNLSGVKINDFLKLTNTEIRLLYKSGLGICSFGVESGSEKILKFINKDLKISDVILLNKRLSLFHVPIRFNFMYGFPTETIVDLEKTISLIFRLAKDNKNLIIMPLAQFIPYPKTKLFDYSIHNYQFKIPTTLDEWSNYEWESLKLFPWISKKKLIKMKFYYFVSLQFYDISIKKSTLGKLIYFYKLLIKIFNFFIRSRINYFLKY